MSRIGNKPVLIPSGVVVDFDGEKSITITGAKGVLTRDIDYQIKVLVKEGNIICERRNNSRSSKERLGLMRSLINNMVLGVSEGFSKTLNIDGVGYKASVNNNVLTLNLGYSHDIKYFIPSSVEIKCSKPTVVVIFSHDKEKLGQVASVIRDMRLPEPYKGKGIKYEDEFIFRKQGKK